MSIKINNYEKARLEAKKHFEDEITALKEERAQLEKALATALTENKELRKQLDTAEFKVSKWETRLGKFNTMLSDIEHFGGI